MAENRRRHVEVVVISDVHLGTYGCHAEELLRYLKSVRADHLILNGDIIDMWQFSKRYWPASHMQVVRHITGLLTRNTKVTYLTGNHDEMLRKFAGFKVGSFRIANKKVLNLDGKRAWIFHGDVFDVTMQYSKWLAKLGAIGYDTLILINAFVNYLLRIAGREKISFSKRIKDSVKGAVKFINDFEVTAADIAIRNGYQFVVCGHIHQPAFRDVTTARGTVTYLNSGDWVENLTALEYNEGQWTLYRYADDPVAQSLQLPSRILNSQKNDELYRQLVREMTGEKK
ncbi:MAG: UDP-2,3-diacylglucosamine diphosphatase [Cyclobacteriaceae bacterium]|nr:UDP-2,3-diacylglucosamine diphosphatase [Cyclobacteriaceae bacterium]